jgi:hypothetical protein
MLWIMNFSLIKGQALQWLRFDIFYVSTTLLYVVSLKNLNFLIKMYSNNILVASASFFQ